MSSHRVIYIATNSRQAHLLRNLLADHGIPAYVINDTLEGTHFEPADLVRLVGGSGLHDTAPRVIVDQRNADEARQIALDAEHNLLHGLTSPDLEALEAEEDREGGDWPACPHCENPRHTSCPYCETSGHEFARAFLPDERALQRAGNRPRALVICPICDEPFAPVYLARCEWCGHRFADGSEPPRPPAPLFEPNENGSFLLPIVLGLIALVAAIFGWCYYILRE